MVLPAARNEVGTTAGEVGARAFNAEIKHKHAPAFLARCPVPTARGRGAGQAAGRDEDGRHRPEPVLRGRGGEGVGQVARGGGREGPGALAPQEVHRLCLCVLPLLLLLLLRRRRLLLFLVSLAPPRPCRQA
eukprot:2089310-Rhodomonas_salina.1